MTKRLFLPGAGASADFWRPVGALLTPAPQSIFLSWPGLGNEPPDPAIRGIDDLVAMVLAELTEPCDVIAQSMGGLIAVRAALAQPLMIRRMVLTVTSAGVPVRDLGGSDWRANYFRSYPSSARWIGDETEDLSAHLHALALPVLLIWGDSDPISPVAVGRQLLELLPYARLHVVRGGGHDLALTHSREVADLIEEHLR